MRKGVPKEILKELDIKEIEAEKLKVVTAIVEGHQVKLPIPKDIRLELPLEKGQKFFVSFDKEKKEIIYRKR